MKRILYILLVLLNLGAQAQKIDRAEYFIDNDPGVGKAAGIPMADAGEDLNLNFTFPIVSLSAGIHDLFVRVRYENGIWGLHEKRTFYIIPRAVDADNISAAEYFIDSDPGVGKGFSLAAGAGSDMNFAATIPLNDLRVGLHNLCIRVKTNDKWGLYERRLFYVAPSALDVTDIVAAEYFIDSDPGLGNGSPLTLSSTGPAIAQTFQIKIPAGTPDGKHYLFIRTRNASGKWSLFERDDFISDRSLPVTGMELTAGSLPDHTSLLKWFTYTEINNSHFEIERSANGSHFEKIGEIAGNGTTAETMYYQFIDEKPLQKMNYYRLKQVDFDGTSAYSRIVYVLFADKDFESILYPNPAVDFVNLKYKGRQSEILVKLFNGSGQCLKSDIYKTFEQVQMDVTSLESGPYMVQVTDGLSQETLRFLKK